MQPTPSPGDSSNKAGGTRLPSLDGVRVAAVLLIALAHGFGGKALPVWLTSATGALFKGGLGMQLFFTLSGFLITSALLDEKRRVGTIQVGRFLGRRLARIMPASYVYIWTLAVLSAAGIIALSWNNILAAAFYVVNYQRAWRGDDGIGYWYVGHFWTLCIEQQYYLIWPWAVLRLSRERLARLAAFLIILMPVLRVLHYYLFPSVRAQLALFFHTGGDCIFIGSLAAALAPEPWNLRKRIGALHWIWPSLAGAWLIWGTVFSRQYFDGWWEVGFARAIIGTCATTVILWLTVHPSSTAGKALNSRPVVYFGSVSYGFFLWQQLFLKDANVRGTLSVLGGFAGAFLLAIISYELMEKRIGVWARKRFAYTRPDRPVENPLVLKQT